MFLLCFSVFSQKNDWTKKANMNNLEVTSKFYLDNDKVQYFELNSQSFKQGLSQAPLRSYLNATSNISVMVPAHNGSFESFVVYEASVFSPSLAARYPSIKSYVGYSLVSPGAQLRMSVSPDGVQTMITYLDKETVFMMPVSRGSNDYVLYSKSSRGDYEDEFVCSVVEDFSKQALEDSLLTARDADDQTLRTYRLAVSVNGEYTTYHGGTVAGALAAINATITRVNAVFETDMGITYQIVDADQLIFLNAGSDPYSSMGAWNGELQAELTANLGEANYDIGHMFGASGGGGNAGCIGCVCEDGSKGSGITSPADGIPMGDNFDIDYVAHEIGHQMGANHTFSMSTEGTGVNAEPGSGTTIMGYAGITGANNVAQHSDPYFHYHSINQVLNNVDNAPNNCAVTTPIVNNPPVANAGNDYSIPQGTAYVLQGSATDADGGDSLTYCWEQTDSGQVTNSSFGPTLTSGSMNRSLPPSVESDRYIPKWSRVVAGELTQINPTINTDWETVATTGRTMNWALTVRDREPTAVGLNGQSSFDLTVITVENVPAFTVVAPPAWGSGTTQDVTWNVGQTNNGTINCQNVNIKFSTDGGLTFPTVLAANTPNDGTQSITVPSVADTNTARILVEAADNIFYAMTPDFPISSTPTFAMNNVSGAIGACGIDSVTYDLGFVTVNGFSETTTFSASGNPAGSSVVFTAASLNADGTFTMTVNGLTGAAAGDYTIAVTGTSASVTKSIDVSLTIIDGMCTSVANTSYDTSTTLVQFGTIDNPSGKPAGYSDYTAISTDVNQGDSYNLTVNMNTDGSYTCVSTVWIDWNQNCIFDANEEYDLGSANGVVDGPSANSPLLVAVPADAVPGNTIMRVTTKYSSSATSCENSHDAEVEDYTVHVVAPLGVDEFEVGAISIFPNPNNGTFNVKLNSVSSQDITISVYDIRGRKVFNNLYENSANFNETIRLNNVESGMYLLNISTDSRTITKKILVN